MIAANKSFGPSVESLQASFLSLMPRIELHAKIFFRYLPCIQQRSDAIAETIALAWKWFIRLARQGKNAAEFVAVLASYAAKAVKCGRRVTRQENGKDVMNPITQRRHNFTVGSLPSRRQSHEALNDGGGQRTRDIMEERLADNTVTPPLDQAAFRIDFPVWLKTLTARERRIIRVMMLNERTKELSRRFELSPGRISQMRREFRDDWRRFVGEEIVAA
jgi:hypothetical protein